MIEIQKVPERSNWERRVLSSGVPQSKWTEGQMAVLLPSYANELGRYLADVQSYLFNSLNEFFKDSSLNEIVDYPAIGRSDLFSAMAKSWAFQEPTTPARVDIAAMKDGSFRLLKVDCDCLDSMPPLLSACEKWYAHHYEGDSSVVGVSNLQQAFSWVFSDLGRNSSRPMIHGVNLLVDTTDPDSEASGRQIASTLGDVCGVNLSEHKDVMAMSRDDFEGEKGVVASIKVPKWSKLLSYLPEGHPATCLLNEQGRFVMPPMWTFAVDRYIDLEDTPPDIEDVSRVLNVWIDPMGVNPVSGVVASSYCEKYAFENAAVYPVVVIAPSESE